MCLINLELNKYWIYKRFIYNVRKFESRYYVCEYYKYIFKRIINIIKNFKRFFIY